MTNSQCKYIMHNLEVELSLIFKAYFSRSITVTSGKGLLEECMISSFCTSVAIISLSSSTKEDHFFGKKKKKERKRATG